MQKIDSLPVQTSNSNTTITDRDRLLKGAIIMRRALIQRAQYLSRRAEKLARIQAAAEQAQAAGQAAAESTGQDTSKPAEVVEERPMLWTWQWIAALVGLGVAPFLVQFALDILPVPLWVGFYVVRPLVWLLLAGGVWWMWRSESRLPPIPFDVGVLLAALLMAGVQIASLMLLGVLGGFGRSPYARGLLPLLGNVLATLVIILAVEMVRALLIAAWGGRHPGRSLFMSGLLMTVASLPVSLYATLNTAQDAVQTVGTRILPTFANHLLASLFSLAGGPAPALAYRGLLAVFEWASPILPDPSWIMMALVGTVVPVIGLVTITDLFSPEDDEDDTGAGAKAGKDKEDSGIGGLLFVGLVAVGLIWFNTGALGVQPTVLSGPSMLPTIQPGDLIITQEVPVEELVVGDIIRFYQEGRYVVHRIIEIEENGNDYVIVTQGDNVNAPDDPINESQYAGKVIVMIPKAGYPSLLLREGLALVR